MSSLITLKRESRTLSIEDFAKEAGISERMARAIESGKSSITVDVALRIAKTLNSTVEELFGEESRCIQEVAPYSDETGVEREGIENVGIFLASKRNKGRVKKEMADGEPKDACKDGKTSEPIDEEVQESPFKPDKDALVLSGATENDPVVGVPSTAIGYGKKTPSVGKLVIEADEPLFEVSNIANGVSTPESLHRVYPPRRSQTISSYFSKTAEEEGLALSPDGLIDESEGRPIRYFDLFCGIGGFRFAAQTVFKEMKRSSKCVLSCDSDRFVQKSYEANFGDRPCGDVATLASEDIPDFDLLFAGFPCQAFSIIGLRKGFEDETKGSLFFQIARILRDKRPRAFVLENVRQLTTHDSGKTFDVILRVLQDELGYCVDWRVLNALDCGLPQKRERVVIVGALEPFDMEWPKKVVHGKTLADILEPKSNVPDRYYASPTIVESRKKKHHCDYRPAVWHENKSGIISSYPYSCALRAGASYNYLLVDGERRFTPLELLRLQGFPDDFSIVVSDAQLRKQVGNAVPVDLVARALERFLPLVFRSKASRKRVKSKS